MRFQALFFDLDGTLIEFDPATFIKTYLGAASRFFSDIIPDSKYFINAILQSTEVMENADTPNQLAFHDFFNDFCPKFEVSCEQIIQRFREFYATDFSVVSNIIKPMDGAQELVKHIKENYDDVKLVVATNPVFPRVAITRRMEWGGIAENLFDYITHAENSFFCKGNQKYWLEIARKLGVEPQNTLVVGNDMLRDMTAKKVGFQTFFIEKTAENEHAIEDDIIPDYTGDLADIYKLLG
ncbi:MAG: HAD family hydrolase [Candidatus Heimdallarchaeaceae archaeon]